MFCLDLVFFDLGLSTLGIFLHLIWFSGWSTWWGGAAHRWHNSGSIAVLNRSLGHGFELLDLLFRDWIQGILDYNFISLFVLYVWLWEHILLSPWHLGPVTQYVLYLQTVWHHPSPGFQGINSKCIYIFILLFILNPPRYSRWHQLDSGLDQWKKERCACVGGFWMCFPVCSLPNKWVDQWMCSISSV